MYNELAQSPLSSQVFRDNQSFSFQEIELASFFQIDCWSGSEALVSKLLHDHLSDESILLKTGPDRFLMISEHEELDGLCDLIPEELGMITDLTHSRTALRLSGDETVNVLKKGLAVDLSFENFPVQSCKQSVIAHIGVLIYRNAETEFTCFAFRSFAQSFHQWLSHASDELS